MKFEYNGYTLEIEEVVNGLYAYCNNLDWTIHTQGGYERIIPEFKRIVDTKNNKKVKFMTQNIKEDKDQILVNQFIEALDKVSREMGLVEDSDNAGYVLITKLKRVYEEYKDTVLSNNDFDYLIDYYSHLQTKKEEEVVENQVPLFMQLNKHKKIVDTIKEVEVKKEEDQEVKLVNQFISDLNQVADEMVAVEKNDYYEVVLEAKLLKLMKSYGESLCLGTMNVYRSHYKYILEQRENKKEEKKKNIPPLKMQFLTTNWEMITVPCHFTENGSIICDPFPQSANVISGSLLVEGIEEILEVRNMKFPLKATYQGEPSK